MSISDLTKIFFFHDAVSEETVNETLASTVRSQGLAWYTSILFKEIASKYNKTIAQILLNWGLCRNTVIIPKSVNSDRIMENSQIFDFELTDEDIDKISSLNKNHRFVDPKKWYKIPYFA